MGSSRTDLAGDGIHDAVVSAVTVSGVIVHAAGYWNDGTRDTACVWAAGERIDLRGDGTHDASVLSVCVSGGLLYAGGYWLNGTVSVPCYWRGGVRTDLPADDGSGRVTSVFLTGD